MKNIHIFSFSLAILFFSISACGGESEEEKQARLQAYQDSLRAVEQAKIADSLSALEKKTIVEKMEETASEKFGFSEDGRFLVQLGAWRSREKAQSFIDGWANREYSNTYVAKIGNELTGDIWYRVRVGYFATSKHAENFGLELASEINSDFWVIRKNK